MEQGKRNRPSSYGQLPGQAKEILKMTQTEVMAREMAKLSEEARVKRGDAADAGGNPPSDVKLGEAGLGDSRLDDAGFAKPSVNGAKKEGSGAAGDDAASAGAGSGEVVAAGWSWPALAAFLVPGIAFAIVWLVG
jgi:hypothetical protein